MEVKLFRFMWALLLLIILLPAQKKITDFRLAPASALDMNISFGLGSSGDIYDNIMSYALRGDAGLRATGKMESEERTLTGDFNLRYEASIFNTDYSDTTIDDYDVRQTYLDLYEKFDSHFYLSRTSFFIAASGNGRIWWHYLENDDRESNEVQGYYGLSGDIGFGRIRDGTASWRALEIERILLAEEVIREPLSHTAILELAQVINQQLMYRMRYDRYTKYYYHDIENVLREYGASDIPIYIWFKIKEIIDERVEPREFGIIASAGLQLHGNAYHRYMDYPDDHSTDNAGEHKARPKLTITSAYPLSFRWQFHEDLELFYDDNGISFGFSNFFSYRVNYRLAIKLGQQLNYNYYQLPPLHNNTDTRLSQLVTAQLHYYIEDRLRITWSNSFLHNWKYENEKRDAWYSTLNLSYDLL